MRTYPSAKLGRRSNGDPAGGAALNDGPYDAPPRSPTVDCARIEKHVAAQDPPKRRAQRPIQPISGLDFASSAAYVALTTGRETPSSLAARKRAECAFLRALNAHAELFVPANTLFSP